MGKRDEKSEQLTEVPESVAQFTHLQSLSLTNFALARLPDWLAGLTELQSLELTSVGLTSLPDSLGQLKQLRSLNLSNSALASLPDSLGQLKELQSLSLANFALTSLPDSLSQLTQLRSLKLSHVRLTHLPHWLGQLTQLQSLSINGNALTALPASLGRLTKLTTLELWMNKLSELPDSFSNLSALKRISFSCNDFAFFPDSICAIQNLTEIYAIRNQIRTIPSAIGRLTRLKKLVLGGKDISWNAQFSGAGYGNLLTDLPPELGALSSLEILQVDGNPLPAEILRLEKNQQLIPYLQALTAHPSQADSRPPRPFDEAKLLLVGPGEVGKTWLLKALQGKTPRQKGSTKGLEIERAPLDLPHPTQSERTLHLSCWDFGGQDNYQITHQIFFSPKAIYLLVWKPRPGIDPDLITRLERIQLSAGKTAKVFIVSTHSDGNVPAVIGHEALRERFGDLIQGFYAVDSGKGPNGTGIAKLKSEIAKATAELEGMDVLFPAEWHDAQRLARSQKSPTLSFREFAEICTRCGMNRNSCESLAIIMDVLGNAVFFGDAPGSGQAGVAKEENLVVLDPEWLAKAVAFVIEDVETQKNSGVLAHKNLRQIWKEDAHRGCPGYSENIIGYLLWLMWKFDIAYKQNVETSLVPELIQRNRPDDLRWTPAMAVPSSERQASLICHVPQEPPIGLIPVLTAAAHPLRRIQILGEHGDRLDRNWRDGFFLDTALRGTAFVELLDRDLRIIVRDQYPSDLCQQIRKTLDRVVKDRWPRLELDYRVPCIGTLASGKACPGTFRWDYLNQRRKERVSCQYCNSNDVEVDKMLEGFDIHTETIMRELQHLKDGQSNLMAAALRIYWDALDPARAELERAPCMFTILPVDPEGWNLLANATENRVRVTCWCEHPDGPHPAVEIGSGKPPEYILKSSKDWLVKVGPYISWAAALFKAFAPFAGSMVKQGLGEMLSGDAKAQIDVIGDASKAIPSGKLELERQDDLESVHRTRPEIVALRHIHDALLDQVPEQIRWGTLRPVRTKSGDLLWLCADHAAQQQPPIQNVS